MRIDKGNMMAKLNKYSGLIMLIINFILVCGGFINTNGKNDEKVNSIDKKVVGCEAKVNKLDDIVRRLEIVTAKLEERTCGGKQ